MSANVEETSPLSEGQSALDQTISSESVSLKNGESEASQGETAEKSDPGTPKPHPMAFTIDFGDSKKVDNRRLEELAKKSQARHQRVQSMSASLTRPSPAAQKPPMSVKLPRKAQGYNSEGYFSSDQEDSGLSGSVKLRSSPLAQITSPISNRHIRSPNNDTFQPKRTSKSPIVDSIMSRSDNFVSRQGLNLPLKNTNCSYMRDVHRTPSYGNLSYQPKQLEQVIDHSPEGVMLTDISSPELDILTPDNGLSTPDYSKSPLRKGRACSETPDLLFKQCPQKMATLFIDDDVDRESNNSSTGTYTIEGDNYTEEQKAKMSIDRGIGADLLDGTVDDTLKRRGISCERDPELIFDYPTQRVITKEPRRDIALRSPLPLHKTFDLPAKVSKDKNVLEISCCYESPTENDLAAQTSKQIKSTRSYLEKIKNRVRTITEKTFAKSPPKHMEDCDIGNFTSVTTSGVLSSKNPPKLDIPTRRRCSLTKSEIDQTDYVHRLSRESSVPVNLPSNKPLPFEAKFESTALKNAQKALRGDGEISSDIIPEQVAGKLSHLSLNRCKGDKTWIQDWADSVKKYNNNTLVATDSATTFTIDSERPPISPRHVSSGMCRSPRGTTPTKIPSPVGTLLHRRTPDLIPQQDTESYLLKTQNAITNLQDKLHSSRNNYNTPPTLTSSLIIDKTAPSRLPISQLSRSNSLNYRLRRRENPNDSSPLRSPGHYVITGSAKVPESTKILLNSASRSLDTDRRNANMKSPNSEGLLSNSSDDKTLSNRPQYDVDAILSPYRKSHSRHRSFDGRNPTDYFNTDANNANQTVCLKTVLKNNALDAKYPRIEQTRCQDTKKHQRILSDGTKQLKPISAFGASIKRSSSFNTVNKNNNYLEPAKVATRRCSGNSKDDYLSDESDIGSYDKSQDRYKRLSKGRIDSPDLKSVAPANSPRCPNTPEPQRKFGPGLVRNSVRVTNKERGINSRMSEPPMAREERAKSANHQSRRISEPTKQAVLNRLTKSRSSTREFQPKSQEKGPKRPSQYRSSSALATKEIEFTNWKKRSSYDPMKAAQEGKRRQMAKRQECNKDDLSSPSHSSPVHRSQSFHTTNIADLTLDYSSEETDELVTLPIDPMITSTHSDILDLRSKEYGKDKLRRQAVNNDVVLARDYVANFQVNQPTENQKRRDPDKRRTYIVDDITPTKDNIDFLTRRERDHDTPIDKRKTFILDSDTNSTTNGSSPRNSSIFSHEKASLTTCTSDTEGESGNESAPVSHRHPKRASNPHRLSGDYSMSSSTTSISKKPIQPRYLDISKYKSENSSKNFLRRDPSKTYVGVLNNSNSGVSKGSAQHYEMEQKKQELEKWKRRASYDPRKAAALGKAKTPVKTASSVLRSQSFHGPMLVSTSLRYQPTPTQIAETYDASSDNDF